MVRRAFPILFVLLLTLPSLALAQRGLPGAIRGSVVDPLDHAVAGATIVLRTASGLVRQTVTSSEGRFEFADVAAGQYELLALADGFRADVVRCAPGSTDARIRLRVSAVTETVVVSAARVPMPLSETAGNVTTIREADLRQRQITTVADALSLVPGFTVSETGGTGALTSLFPRGGGSDYTLVLADGIRLNSMGGGFDLGHLAAAGVQQIDVVRGPQSAVFGADAIGGVVQLQSKVGGRPAVAADIETGGYGLNRLAMTSSGSLGRVAWGAAVEQRSSDGWTGVAPGTTTRVSNDDDHASTVTMVADVRLTGTAALRFSSRFERNDRGYPGPFGSNPVGAYSGIDRISRGKNDNGAGAVLFTQALGSDTSLRAQATYADLQSTFISPWGDSKARTRRWTANAQMDRSFSPAVGVSAGVDAMGERGESTYVTGESGQAVPVSRQDAGAFVETRVRAGNRLALTAGLRADALTRDALEADPFAWVPRPVLPADREWSLNPRAAVSYLAHASGDAGNTTRIHASAGTGIRPPSALDIAFTDNPGLRPERNRSVDAGVEQGLRGGRVLIDATWFANSYTDLIVAVGRSLQDFSRFRTDNISNARSRGVETSVALRTANGLAVRASYTRMNTSILAVANSTATAPPPFSVGDPLLRRPSHQGSVDVVWTRSRLTVSARVQARGSVLDVEPSYGAFGGLFSAPGYAVADGGVAYRLANGVDVHARLSNLFNRAYEAVYGYPAPGRTLTVGVRVAAGR